VVLSLSFVSDFKFWGAAGWQLIRLKISAGQFKTARPLHFPYTSLPFLYLFPPTQAMAHPTPNRPLPPVRLLTHGVSSLTVRHLASGEIIMLRLPLQILGPGSFISPSAITGSTNNNYHPCIVLKSHMTGNSWILDLFICCSFTQLSDPVTFIASLTQEQRKQFIPLPWTPALDTPTEFGAPLSILGYYPRK